jgi:very-short-patch-repair endonuclease
MASSRIDRWVAGGRLVRLHRGVYAVGHAQLRREGRWLAAVLAAGPEAVLSHRDAAGLHGLRPANHRTVDVTTVRRAASAPGIRVHRTTVLSADDVTTRRGVPVTTVARTLVDLAAVVADDHLMRAVLEAERLRLLDVTAVRHAMARTRARHGDGHRRLVAILDEQATQRATHTRSTLEDAFLELVARAGLPTPSVNASVAGLEVDAVWRSARLVVELDGWAFHNTTRAFERDRERANALTCAGYKVLRFTHDAVMRRSDAVARQLTEALALRRRYPPAP